MQDVILVDGVSLSALLKNMGANIVNYILMKVMPRRLFGRSINTKLAIMVWCRVVVGDVA